MATSELDRDIEVKQHTSDKAIVVDCFLKLPRELMRDLEYALARKAGMMSDNNVVYEVTCDKKVTYIWFHDRIVVFGNGLNKKHR